MSKFKDLIKKVASKFSTPVKPMVSEVFEEENFKIDMYGNVKAKNLKIDVSVADKEDTKGLNNKVSQLIVDWKDISKMIDAIDKEYKIKQLKSLLIKTKSSRIKKKLQKRINGYGKNSITRN
ncbi:hypothetical protein [Paenibacillus illinoisensis]|uniref:Uncharacterized protein n=1 Tax=Paenibacillus illinoisensis TaxID=59845 RepID=A0A2W0C8E1_9BACL|nr:hypothetical protein [Paenibacillus illinoisensis]PYY28274.1 hypothetical protein PIL02S_03420 [Paenibacillus illinoisensis]